MTGWLFLTAPYYLLRDICRWLLWRRRLKVTLIYKSGAKQRLRGTRIETKKDGGQLTSITVSDALPEAFVFGVDEIAGVYVN